MYMFPEKIPTHFLDCEMLLIKSAAQTNEWTTVIYFGFDYSFNRFARWVTIFNGYEHKKLCNLKEKYR